MAQFKLPGRDKSCRGRCGEAYYRGNACQCDYECLSHKECCKNYESLCTTGDSCKGRCGEHFKRGQVCHCDIECVKFKQCCPDYEAQCTVEDDYDPDEEVIIDGTPVPEVASGSESLPSAAPEDKAMDSAEIEPTLPPVLPEDNTDLKDLPVPEENPESPQAASESEHSPIPSPPTLPPLVTSTKPTTTQQPSDQPLFPTSPGLGPTPASDQDAQANIESTSDPKTTLPTTAHPSDLEIDASNPTELKPTSPDQTEGVLAPETKPEPQTEQLQLEPSENAKGCEGVSATNLDPTEKPSAAEPTKPQENIKDSPSTKAPSATPASEKVDPSPTKAPEKPTKPKVLDEGSTQDYQADANNDTNLCSGRPVNGLTTLRNGTIVVFRGHYFWTLDSRRNPGPPLGITDVWGIPSPIDTVYTRCNCEGKTYFFKGDNYWRFENGIMDAGFPRPVSAGFGLSGQITAALSMPQYRSRKESVFFFKKGGLAQRYSYRITPQCGRNTAVYTVSMKVKRQADPELGPEIDIRKTWRGFPSTVTSAVSVPSSGGDGYKYYIFSRTKYYSLKMEGNTPVILTPRDGPGKQKSAKSWFRCPETQSL
ncbi:proteoglycan 4b [Colossoma macropomum]|uniref:proteoglycan 4b n=1 Tax=Colossoma macropomum TaxID=42526 RepID=UPI0018640BF2|nr:proteoglycan 4b [Colossoma macropomum]